MQNLFTSLEGNDLLSFPPTSNTLIENKRTSTNTQWVGYNRIVLYQGSMSLAKLAINIETWSKETTEDEVSHYYNKAGQQAVGLIKL